MKRQWRVSLAEVEIERTSRPDASQPKTEAHRSGRQPGETNPRTKTGKEYTSEGAAGRDLYGEVEGDVADTFVWVQAPAQVPGPLPDEELARRMVNLDDVEPGSTRP